MTTMPDRATLLAEELLLVRHSGEIPEIAFHGALHFLCADPEGPGLTLTAGEIRQLAAEAIARYQEILRRDLDPANRDLRLYRGLKRCLCNWQRLENFLARQGLAGPPGLRAEIADRLAAFLHNEAREVGEGVRPSSVNCTAQELAALCQALAVDTARLPAGWHHLCQRATA